MFSAIVAPITNALRPVSTITRGTLTTPLEHSFFAGPPAERCGLGYFAGALDCCFDMPRM